MPIVVLALAILDAAHNRYGFLFGYIFIITPELPQPALRIIRVPERGQK
jgi:hypothetical protein